MKIYLIILFSLIVAQLYAQQSSLHVYDPSNRLTKTEYSNQKRSFYYYDPNGNRTLSITSNPVICNGGKTYFHAGTIDTASTYQWQVDSGSGFSNITNNSIYTGSSTHTIQLTTPPTSWYGYTYRCQITGVNGTSYSSVDTLKFQTVWKGTVNDAWENYGNWSCGIVPDQYTDVVINAGTPFPPMVNSNAFVRSLQCNSGVHVTVNPSFIFTIVK